MNARIRRQLERCKRRSFRRCYNFKYNRAIADAIADLGRSEEILAREGQ